MNDNLQKIADHIKGIEYAMLTTRERDGTLHSRPMKTEEMEDDGTLLFLTSADSVKAEELEIDPHISLTYMKTNGSFCVAIAGEGRIRRGLTKIKELWKPTYKMWFPKGLEDPELVLLDVKIQRAEYWESSVNPVRWVFGAAKAVVKGKAVVEEVSHHEKLTLREK